MCILESLNIFALGDFFWGVLGFELKAYTLITPSALFVVSFSR
jgi:hypothetical protein